MAISLIEKFKLTRELNGLRQDLGSAKLMQKIKITRRINEIRVILLGGAAAAAPEVETPNPVIEPDTPAPEELPPGEAQPRVSTAQFYTVRAKGQGRQTLNNVALALMKKLDEEGRAPNEDEKAILAKYSGNGGGLIGADGKKGSAYEYYTPMPIAEGIWDALEALGFNGGKVLDPSAGTGIFGAAAPLNAAVDAVELSKESGRINQLVNDGPGYKCAISPFEAFASKTPDGIYDAVVTNVPFGDVSARGGNQFLDAKYQDQPLENYFILRALEKLRPGGLAAFITPTRCVSEKGGKAEDMRLKASLMAEFLGAYRLPTGTFSTASTDTVTDVMFFRKFEAETADKINDLYGQEPQTLRDANVLWDTFLSGKWFDSAEGRPYMLGEFVAKDPKKFRDVDKVISSAGLSDLKEILQKRRLPSSRIDWKALDAAETVPIVYQEGDHITQAGVTLEMRDGIWVALPQSAKDVESAKFLAQIDEPYKAFENKVKYADFERFIRDLKARSVLDLPIWASAVYKELDGAAESVRPKLFNKVVIALSARQLREEHREDAGFNYLDAYKEFSAAFKKARISKADAASARKLGGSYIASALTEAAFLYDKSHESGFGRIWRGEVSSTATAAVQTAPETPQEKLIALRYARKTPWLTVEEARSALGVDFNPITDADWCISPDGKRCIPADDYYVGNYGEFLDQIDEQIKNAATEEIRDKLIRQKTDALGHVRKPSYENLTFNLFSPFVTVDEKVSFLKLFVNENAKVSINARTEKQFADIDIPNPKTNRDKLLNRFGEYMKYGSITLGRVELVDMTNEEAIAQLRQIVNTANEQFNAWVRSNKTIQARIAAQANNAKNLRFALADDESELRVPGMNPNFHLHGYQSAFVRKMAREFAGINGFGVGLGKTATALAAVQHVQTLGVKKKTLFVVPNAVLSNWRKEAKQFYASLDDCLFVGLRLDKNGKATVKSANFDEDLHTIQENRHSKIFMTMEAFERLKLRDETIEAYGNYMMRVDQSYADSEDKKKDETNKSARAGVLDVLSKKTGSAPYLEDLGVDSLVIDEAHFYKNSAETVDFKGAQYLSLSPASKRGIDAQAKAWYIRGATPLHDGVLLLTATPITNSPLEMYSMMSLAVGHERVNRSCVNVRGADDFMNVVCRKENRDATLVDGQATTRDVFVGLDNVDVLREALADVATIKSAEDVGSKVVIPEREQQDKTVQLSAEARNKIALYKSAYRYAIDALKEDVGATEDNLPDLPFSAGRKEDFIAVQAKFGESIKLIGHPFNLINKMTMIIADPELDERASFYDFPEGQQELAKKVLEEFNAKKYRDNRSRLSKRTDKSCVLATKEVRDADTKEVISVTYTVWTKAAIEGNRIALDSLDYATQQAFEEIAAKNGLELSVTTPPKIAALIENVKAEMATPRGLISQDPLVKSPIVKQIVFCDILALHSKIKKLLSEQAGIPAAKIAIITGSVNNTPDEILSVQDGFNGQGDDNRYQLIIANEKAEVGINLQKGTQAIHHLTIGWTPDSLEQRNGRGARQGNMTEKVRIYYYDADGTFDVAKRTMVNHKAKWISNLTDPTGANSVDISGGLSREDMEILIAADGDPDAVRRAQELKEQQEKLARASSTRDRQRINGDIYKKQSQFIKDNESPFSMAKERIVSLWALDQEITKTKLKIEKLTDPKKAAQKERAEKLLAHLQSGFDRMKTLLDSSLVITDTYGASSKADVESVLHHINNRYGRIDADTARIKIGDNDKYSRFKFEVRPEGGLYAEWQEAVGQAQSLCDSAKKTFQELSSQTGGYPSDMLDEIAAGATAEFQGKLVARGCFMRVNGLLGWIHRNENNRLSVLYYDGEKWKRANKEDKIQAVYSNDPEYERCLIEAADIEDKTETTRNSDQEVFSVDIPQVLNYRKITKTEYYRIRDSVLPPPYFPIVITKAQTEKLAPGMLKPAILPIVFESQKEVVRSIDGSGDQFGVRQGTDVRDMPGGFDDTFLTSIIEYAKAHGLRVNKADIMAVTYLGYLRSLFSNRIQSFEPLYEMLNNAEDADERGLFEIAFKWVLDSQSDWLDPTGFKVEDRFMPQEVDVKITSISRERSRKEEAAKAAEAQKQLDNSPDSATVYVSGDTYRCRNDIKSCASAAGTQAVWMGSIKAWRITLGAWKRFKSLYPETAAGLNVSMDED